MNNKIPSNSPCPWDKDMIQKNRNHFTLDANDENIDEQVIRNLQSGFRFCVIKNVRFLDSTEEDKQEQILKFSSMFGKATSADRTGQNMTWHIKPWEEATSEFLTYSQHSDHADLHTDTQYFPNPESIMSLWCINPARDGGGVTYLADGRMAKSRLAESEDGKRYIETLSKTEYPFLVPPVFSIDSNYPEIHQAPILGEYPFIRYRRQTINEALKKADIEISNEQAMALKALDDILNAPGMVFPVRLEQGDALFVNNHEILHGRSAFKDKKRHLIRVRLNYKQNEV